MNSELLYVLVIALVYHATPLNAESHYTNEWAARIPGGPEQAQRIAKRQGYDIISAIPNLEDRYVLVRKDVPHRSKRSSHHHTRRLMEDGQVLWAEQQVARSRVKRTDVKIREDGNVDFDDPEFGREWYLRKSETAPRERSIHHDLRVVEAWAIGYSGKDVVVSILDDGIEHNNTDLKANYEPKASCDLNSNDEDPMPRYDPTNENKHGTRCAGEIAMVANNGKCGVGIAFNSKIGGVRMLDGRVTDSLEARALGFNINFIDIFSSSWGPNDDGVTLEGPGTLAAEAMEAGATKGRNGKGVIYAWASGNGGRLYDSCNCDGYTSSIYTLSVSSASENGITPWYGELCSSTFTTTYSSGNGGDHQVVSADLHNECTTRHTGTSAAAPMAAGIFALALEANPNLTWRDMQHLVALTSKASPLEQEKGWYANSAGFCVNLAFGFGLLDAAELVTVASNWVNVPNKTVCEITADAKSNLPQRLTSGNVVEVLIETNGCQGQENEINYLEHVQFVFTQTYTKRGSVSITAVSPSGTETVLMRERQYDRSTDGFHNWPLMSVHTWGEDPTGVWRFRVQDDDEHESHHGELKDLKLILHGTKDAPHYRRNETIFCDITVNSAANSTEDAESKTSSETDPDRQRDAGFINQLLQQLTDGTLLGKPAEQPAIREDEFYADA